MTTVVELTEAPEVITRAQAGDPTAIAELYDEYWGLVFRFCYRRTSNTHLAEDLATDVFVRLIKKVDTFEWRGQQISAWLLVVARNMIADRYKSKAYQKEVHSGIGVDYASEYPNPEQGPEEAVTDRVTYDLVIGAIGRLASREQGEVLRLRFLEDLSVEEVAEKMGVTIGTVKALQYRAVRSMRRLFPDGSPL